ncbi:MAG: hypothetical protein GYA55_07725, partial [SAR324 cluster bacterium]|nr:hypothetical protein [SAR324 cluster bacterium]
SYIGVDILMALFCAAAISSGLYVRQYFSLKALFFCGILSGLAVSSKYNALPVVILPLIVSISAKSFDWRSVAVALFSPVLGFLLGSPFALVSLPLFLNQLAYEIWHYGVQGHEGHMAEPGLPQLLFYMKWLGKSALGYGLLISSIIGLLVLVWKRDLKGKIFIIFPLLFIAQMCMQKANFERNMLVVIPLLGIVSIVGIDWMLRAMKLGERKVHRLILLIVILFSIQPALRALQLRNEAKVLPESRRELAVYLESLSRNNLRIGLAGQLQMPPQIYSLGGTNKIDQMKISSGEIDLSDFDVIVVHGPVAMTGAIFELEKEFPGEVGPQRVVKNPLIQVYRKRRGN